MKKLIFLSLITALTIIFTGCSSAPNTNNARNNAVNATPINVVAPTANANTNTNRWNSKISKEEYEKDRARYEASKDKDSWGNTLEDSWLWFKVRSALMTADDLRETTISVSVAKDVVTLTGTVRDEAQKKKAGEVAKVDGVTSVKNELKVAPKDSVTNTKLSMTDSDKTPAPKPKK
jgi:osmotically-inducible protein OsmY